MFTLVRWAVEQWCHGHPLPEGPPPTVVDVVPPHAWVEEVVAEAERYCRDAVPA